MAKTEQAPIPVPELTPEGVRVFLASPDMAKRIAVVHSLKQFGLGDNVYVATSWRQAAHFVHTQEPGELEANVFFFDGQLDRDETAQANRQGNRLMHGLFNNFKSTISEITRNGLEQVIKDGLTPYETSQIFHPEVLDSLAARRLGAEALLVGISESSEGALSYPAQVPLCPYAEVGQTVFDRVVKPTTPQIAA